MSLQRIHLVLVPVTEADTEINFLHILAMIILSHAVPVCDPPR